MRFVYTIVIALCVIAQTLLSNDIDVSKLPKLLGTSNMGREFYFSFIPGWETNTTDHMIYISSNVRTKVKVEIKRYGYEKIKYTIPNDIIQFSLAAAYGQPYRKTDRDLPEPDQNWLGAAVHVISEDPIICYTASRYDYSSDGFLAIPINSLGKEYIVASYADPTDNEIQWLPSYTSITAAYDKTKVRFTMGGTDSSTTASGQRPREVSYWNINAGDVLLFGSLGAHAELTGSRVEATKPVAVVSGNFCAYIPTNCGCCDYIIEMELPTNTWGTEYHVTKIIERKKNSIVRIFAKEANTKIYRDFYYLGEIQKPGGDIEGIGWMDMRADTGSARPIVISGDKPISVTQYNTSQSDDNVPSDPFQMVLSPVEQYQKEITFHTPGIRGGFGFPKNYINIIYEATPWGTIPEYFEFAKVVAGEFEWQQLMDLSPNPGSPFEKEDGGKIYYSKTMLLPGDGVYKFRSSTPFQAYSYGFSSYDSYGFPASVSLADLTIVDTLPPEPLWGMDCQGNVNAGLAAQNYVSDKPDDADSSANLSMIYMASNYSYNYKLNNNDFMPCEDQTTAWSLETIDPTEDALAVVIFADCAGNDTTLIIEYYAPDIKLIHKEYNFGRHKIGESSWEEFNLINNGESAWICQEISLKQKDLKGEESGFSLWAVDKNANLQFPIRIPANDTLHFLVHFEATEEGMFWDSIGYGDTCFFVYKSYIEAEVGQPIIDVSDWDFPPTNVGGTAYGQFDIKNIGSVDLTITGYEGAFLVGTISGDRIFKSSDLEDINISENNPLILRPAMTRTFEIRFTPDDTIKYKDGFIFESNSSDSVNGEPVDSIAYFTGSGLESDLKATSYNWERKRIHRTAFPVGPYPATINATNADTSIRLTNSGNTDITILNIIDKNQIGDVTAFQLNKADLIGQVIPGGGELIVPVYFQPIDIGVHTYTFEYQTSNSGVVGVQTTLQGVGIVPHISTMDVDFGKTIINDFTHAVSKQVTIRNEPIYDWQYGDSVQIFGLIADNAYNDLVTVSWDDISEPFRYDENTNPTLHYPIILQPGESVSFDTEFVARSGNAVIASVTTESDAEAEVTSEWVGAGLVPSTNVVGDNTTICLGMNDILDYVVTNDGETDMLYNNFQLSNTRNFEFIDAAIPINGFSLAPGENRTVEVRFTAYSEGTETCSVSCDATAWLGEVADLAPWNIQLVAELLGNTVHYERELSIQSVPPETTPIPVYEFIEKTISINPGDSLNLSKVLGFYVQIEFDSSFIKLKHNPDNETFSEYDLDMDGIILGSVFDDYPVGAFKYRIYNYDNDFLNIEIMRQQEFENILFNSPAGGELLKFSLYVDLTADNINYSEFNITCHPIEENGTCIDFVNASSEIIVDSASIFNTDKLKVYPNPADNYMEFDFLPLGLEEIEIMDLNGRIVKKLEQFSNSSSMTINILDLAIGSYIMRLKFKNEIIDMHFVISR